MVILDRHQWFEKSKREHPHMARYLDDWKAKGRPPPEFYVNLESRMRTMEEFNFIYPVKPPDYIHTCRFGARPKEYIVVEPGMTEETKNKYAGLAEELRQAHPELQNQTSRMERWSIIDGFLTNRATTRAQPEPGWLSRKLGLGPAPKMQLSEEELGIIILYLERESAGRGPLTPMVCDPYLNELNSVGGGRLEVVHKVWGTMEVSKRFKNAAELDGALEREASRPGPTLPPEHPLSFRASRGKTGIIHR